MPDLATPRSSRTIARAIFGLALLGVLVVTHLWFQKQNGFTRGCLGFSEPTGEVAGCAAVVNSSAGTIFGVSNVLFGGVFYLGLLALRTLVLAIPARAAALRTASLGVAAGGFAYAVYLVGYQNLVLDRYCVLCLTNAAIVTLIFGLHLLERRRTAAAPPEPNRSTMSRELSRYGLAALALVVLLGADVAYNTTARTAPEPAPVAAVSEEAPAATSPLDMGIPGLSAATCTYDAGLETMDTSPFTADLPFEGAEDAEVEIVKFFDPNCPHCQHLHETIEGVWDDVEDEAKIYYQPFAIWPFSVPHVQALYLAQEEGKFKEMLDLQMTRPQRGGIPLDGLANFAAEIGMDRDQFLRDLRARTYVDDIQAENEALLAAGVSSFPQMTINGKFVQNAGGIEPICFEYLVETEARAQRGK
jgi:protein-disulfide isomerase/uncharacterized membrane protein